MYKLLKQKLFADRDKTKKERGRFVDRPQGKVVTETPGTQKLKPSIGKKIHLIKKKCFRRHKIHYRFKDDRHWCI